MSASIHNSSELLHLLEKFKVVLDPFDSEVIGRVAKELTDGNMKDEMLCDWAAALNLISYKYRSELEVGDYGRRINLLQETAMSQKEISVEIFVKVWTDGGKCSHLTTISANIPRSSLQIHQPYRDTLELKNLRGSNLSPGHTVVQLRCAMHGHWVAICDAHDLSSFILHSQLYGLSPQLTADVVPSASISDPNPRLQCGKGLLKASSIRTRRQLVSFYESQNPISALCDGGIFTNSAPTTTTTLPNYRSQVYDASCVPIVRCRKRIKSEHNNTLGEIFRGTIKQFCDAGAAAPLEYVFDAELDQRDDIDGEVIESNYKDTDLNSDDDDNNELELKVGIPHDSGPFVTAIAPDGSGRFTVRIPPDAIPGGDITHTVPIPVNRVCRTFDPRPADFSATEGTYNWGIVTATYSEVPNKLKRVPSAAVKGKATPTPWTLNGVSLRLRQGALKRPPDIFEFELANGSFTFPGKKVPQVNQKLAA